MEANTSIYGWQEAELDSHLTKSSEWGAVSYLAHSKYGLNGTEIGKNDNLEHYTGGGTGTYWKTNTDQSTTGNISGVYDMNGGDWEFVASYYLGGAASTYGNACLLADSKYCEAYGTTHESGIDHKGDALYETNAGSSVGLNAWFENYSSWPTSTSSWFKRGGRGGNTSGTGLFAFHSGTGEAYSTSYDTFRPVLIAKPET
jgi:formylglycine-generating enzyme required for sulfatase activity